MKKFFVSLAICTLSVSSFASPVGGERRFDGALPAGAGRNIAIALNADEEVMIVARGLGEGDLDCALLNEKGEVLDVDVDHTNTCLINGHVNIKKVYTIRVENNGRVDERFEMVVR